MANSGFRSLLVIILFQSIAVHGAAAPKKRKTHIPPYIIAKQQLQATRTNNDLLEKIWEQNAELLKALQLQNTIHTSILRLQEKLNKQEAEPFTPTSACATPFPVRTPMSRSFANLAAAAHQAGQLAMAAASPRVSLSASTPNLKALAPSVSGAKKKSATVPLSTITSPANADASAETAAAGTGGAAGAAPVTAASAAGAANAPKAPLTISVTEANE